MIDLNNKGLETVLVAVCRLPEDTRQNLLLNDPPHGATFELMNGLVVRVGDAVEILGLIRETRETNTALLRRIINLPSVEDRGGYDYL